MRAASEFEAEADPPGFHRNLTRVVERCREQRQSLALERERLRLCDELRNHRARMQLRRAFLGEVEAAVRPLVESASQK